MVPLPYFGYAVDFAVTNAHFEVNGCDFDMQPRCKHHHVAEYSNGTMNSQEAKMIHNFSANVLSGKIDPKWSEIALKTQIVLDRLLAAAR